ncbi:MAG: VWA domain-containing protein [Gemmatimonadales bacterium]|jgi:Ca-activated chloride channel family protein
MIYRFANPYYLLLLLALPILVYWYISRRSRKGGTIRYSNLAALERSAPRSAVRHRHALFALRLLALAGLIVAFARPQTGVTGETVRTEGIDIVLALDLSSSMLAEDLEPNRIEAVKQVAADFVAGRTNDRVGLVAFAAEAFTQAPLTLDHDVVVNLITELEVGMIEDGTAVGLGLATAVKRLQESEAESKVVVLLTDGRNNRGEIDPGTAAQMAQALGVKVYTIGAGGRGTARVPIDDPYFGRRYVQMRVDIDEAALQQIAELTGGRYFRATDRESLENIYADIDELETTEIEVEHFTRYGELFRYPLMFGLALIVLEMALGNTVLRKLP